MLSRPRRGRAVGTVRRRGRGVRAARASGPGAQPSQDSRGSGGCAARVRRTLWAGHAQDRDRRRRDLRGPRRRSGTGSRWATADPRGHRGLLALHHVGSRRADSAAAAPDAVSGRRAGDHRSTVRLGAPVVASNKVQVDAIVGLWQAGEPLEVVGDEFGLAAVSDRSSTKPSTAIGRKLRSCSAGFVVPPC